MNPDQKKSDTPPSFEEAYARLEEITRELEDGSATLRASFALYEEGQKLLKLCHTMLNRAEKRLKILKEEQSGTTFREMDLD